MQGLFVMAERLELINHFHNCSTQGRSQDSPEKQTEIKLDEKGEGEVQNLNFNLDLM